MPRKCPYIWRDLTLNILELNCTYRSPSLWQNGLPGQPFPIMFSKKENSIYVQKVAFLDNSQSFGQILIYRLVSLPMYFFFGGGGLFLDKYGIWIAEVKRWTLFISSDFFGKEVQIKSNALTQRSRPVLNDYFQHLVVKWH